jgi:hypothetical protein
MSKYRHMKKSGMAAREKPVLSSTGYKVTNIFKEAAGLAAGQQRGRLQGWLLRKGLWMSCPYYCPVKLI